MNSREQNTGWDGSAQGDEGMLESLLRAAAARPKPPRSAEQRVRRAVIDAWLDTVRRRKRRRLAFGMAASLLLASILALQLRDAPHPAERTVPVATVVKQVGDVYVSAAGGDVTTTRRAAFGDLHPGEVLSTAPGAGLAVSWLKGASIRFDQNTEVRLISPTELELRSGRLYLDVSPLTSGRQALHVRTRAGSVSHVGTQYMAEVGGMSLAVSVREGRVRVTTPDSSDHASASEGERIDVGPGGVESRQNISTYGNAWAWAETLAPGFSLDGRSTYEFLHWVGRETGRTIDFADQRVERLARATTLHGEMDVAPLRALELVLLTSDLAAVVEADRIVIREKP